MIREKSLYLGISLETIGLKTMHFSGFWAVKIASWSVRSLHDFDSIRLCRKIWCCCQNRLMIREIASWLWQQQFMQKSTFKYEFSQIIAFKSHNPTPILPNHFQNLTHYQTPYNHHLKKLEKSFLIPKSLN